MKPPILRLSAIRLFDAETPIVLPSEIIGITNGPVAATGVRVLTFWNFKKVLFFFAQCNFSGLTTSSPVFTLLFMHLYIMST